MKAMIVAAGLGTRLKPLTNTMPKAMVPVAGKPLIEQVIRKLTGAGITELVINIHHFPEQIIRFVRDNDSFGATIHFSDETELLLETGGGIRKARKWLEDDEFIVHNVDILSNLDVTVLTAQHQRTQPLATLVVSERETFRYFLFDDNLRLNGWTNLKTGEMKPSMLRHYGLYRKLAFSGIQILSPEIFPLMEQWPERFSITDFYLENMKEHTILGYVQDDYRMLDVGKPESIKQASEFLKR